MPTANPQHTPAPTPDTSAAWSVRGIGQSWQHRFFHRLIRTFGKRPAYHIAYIVVFWYVCFNRSVRARTRFYLSRRFPTRTGPLQRFADTYRLVGTFAQTLIDLATVGILGPRSITTDSVQRTQFSAFCTQPGGIILLNSHVGCWQIGLSTLSQTQKQVRVVMIPEPSTQSRLDPAVASIIDPRTGMQAVMDMTQALLQGQLVSMMADRTFGDDKNIVTATFLGAPVAFPLTPYRIASATGAPIGIMMVPKVAFRRCEMRFVKIITVPPNLGRSPQAYAPYAQQYAGALEDFTREFPWQFFNFFDLWAVGKP